MVQKLVHRLNAQTLKSNKYKGFERYISKEDNVII